MSGAATPSVHDSVCMRVYACGGTLLHLPADPGPLTVSCPLCLTTHSREDGVASTIAAPLADQRCLPRCIVLKRATGHFTSADGCGDRGAAPLHIGISDSKGNVFNFDYGGVAIDAPDEHKWPECVGFCCDRTRGDAEWDEWLQGMALWFTSSQPDYEAGSYNCFDYVLAHLNALSYAGCAEWTKARLSSRILGAGVRAAEQFGALVGRLTESDNATRALYHTKTSEYSCTLATAGPSGAGPTTVLEHADCPVCLDYRQWRLDAGRAAAELADAAAAPPPAPDNGEEWRLEQGEWS